MPSVQLTRTDSFRGPSNVIAPRTGDVISGLDAAGDGVEVTHAGTAARDGGFVTAGGRVLNVTALGPDSPMKPVPLSETLAEFVIELGVNAVGGCCGTTPDHIRVIAKLAAKYKTPWQPT